MTAEVRELFGAEATARIQVNPCSTYLSFKYISRLLLCSQPMDCSIVQNLQFRANRDFSIFLLKKYFESWQLRPTPSRSGRV